MTRLSQTAHDAARLAAIAAVRAVPRGVISHRSAALLLGIPLVGARLDMPDMTVPRRSGANVPGVHIYRAPMRPEDIVDIGGVAVSSPARTLGDLSRHCSLTTAVCAADAALHCGLVTIEEIQDVLAFCSAWPLIRRARRALPLFDGRAESPLESISRMVLPTLGVPAPDVQTNIFDTEGRLAGRGDFYWDDAGVVGEADGRSKYDARPVLTGEKERQERLEDLGLVVVRWNWSHVGALREVLRRKLQNAFERGRRRDRSGFPRQWTL